ncbi:MAG: methylmalonyl-CoA mutase family protein [Deltaproteobacteria bacterium]|nr:methylmalonyl-CoA mutase family protein [Deltaproteobacteria bacterium]
MRKETSPEPANCVEEQPSYKLRNRVRIVTAASLFDGHDASINIIRRLLQSSGTEVIHLGHNRSVSDIVTAAIQEDVQAISVSSYQGGHIEFFKFILDSLTEQQSSHIKVFGGGGGTITPAEALELEKVGVTKLYSPQDGRSLGLQGIIDHLLRHCDQHPLEKVDWLRLPQFDTNPRALAHAMTCIEMSDAFQSSGPYGSHTRDLQELQAKILAKNKTGTVVGVTGPGGAGKSSFTDEIVLRLLEKESTSRIAILAIDPTRRKTGGALLGDRLRMNSLSDPRCFMRSLATRQMDASLSEATKDAIALLRAANFDWIFVETGGIGQADTSIVDLVDINIYVMTCEFGAPTQLEKINMLDYADLVIINKFDKSGSADALLEVRKAFRRNHQPLATHSLELLPVFGTIASRFGDCGLNQAFEHLYRLREPDTKTQALTVSHVPDSSRQSIVPREKSGYLSEIATVVRGYKERIKKNADRISQIEALEKVLAQPNLSPETRLGLQSELAPREEEVDADVSFALKEYPAIEKQYRQQSLTYEVRKKSVSLPAFHESLCRNQIPKIATPRLRSKADLAEFLMLENFPGRFPYTAGVFPLKNPEESPKRQFAGEGTPTRTNRRFHLLCDGEKAKRLSTAFDSVTLYGEDPNERPDIFGKVGESGVSICTLDDMKKLYAGFDLCDPSTSVSMTINGPAPMMLAFFFNTAIDQQMERFRLQMKREPNLEQAQQIKFDTLRKVRGTVQADILKEDQAQNTCIFSTEFALRMMGDIQQYFVENKIRNYYSVSISGYHIAEAGANPISQLAFTLANGFTYVEYYLSRGMPIDSFAPNLSFFFSNGLDPEYTVIGRVARRIWSTVMKYRYGGNERSQKLKYHIQTSGRSLHAQEIAFNDIRTTLQGLIAMMDNCNSLHTNAYDEAVTTPTEESVRRAMAIQLIIAKEFGWAKNENALQGSYFIQWLTELVEEQVLAEFDRISTRGGVLGAMEAQYQRSKIQEESLYYENLKHSGELPIIGVNTFLSAEEGSAIKTPDNLTRATLTEKKEQIDNLAAFQAKHSTQSPQALEKLKNAALSGENIFEVLMEVARVCSLSQMTNALYHAGGKYRRPI